MKKERETVNTREKNMEGKQEDTKKKKLKAEGMSEKEGR